MRLAPSSIADRESREKIVAMIRTFFSKDAEQISSMWWTMRH